MSNTEEIGAQLGQNRSLIEYYQYISVNKDRNQRFLTSDL